MAAAAGVLAVSLLVGAIAAGMVRRAAEPVASEGNGHGFLGAAEGDDPVVVAEVAPRSAEAAAPAVAAPAVDTTGYVRVKKPDLPTGPRRVGIQAGHWLTEQAPPELGRILSQTGTSWAGIKEVEINLDIARRVAAILGAKGIVVDVLATTIPPGYVADAFLALHGDGDGVGAKSGYKIAHSTRRGPYEDALVRRVGEEYAKATGLAFDDGGVSRGMLGYYAHAWTRVRYATAPHTPSAILEMGFVSHDHDRWLLTTRADTVAQGIATGLLRFLGEHTREMIFGDDLLVPPFRFVPLPLPTGR